jgi:positive regulator of sigma E activity
VSRSTEESTAAGVYGIIVGAAVMAASKATSAVAVVVAVLVTLVVYWGAERYARIVAGRIHDGRRPDRRELLSELTTGWAMVSTSVLPLVVLIVARVLGAGLPTALLWALGCSTLLLGLAGWEVGRNGRLTPRERLVSAATAAAFGGVLIVLKVLLH